MLQQNRMTWCGYVLRKDANEWVKVCVDYLAEADKHTERSEI